MLIGTLKPTSGRALIFGYDVTRMADLRQIRRLTGLCPQEDVLFEFLTCREHLVIYAIFRGEYFADVISASLKRVVD